jgi:hypothetical protein
LKPTLKPGQFTLKALFGATAFVAAAAALVQFIRTTPVPFIQFEAAFLVPVLLCAAVGTLRGLVWRWVSYGCVFDLGLMLLALIDMAVYT